LSSLPLSLLKIIFVFDGVINDEKLNVKLKRLSNQASDVYQKLSYIHAKTTTTNDSIPRFNNILPIFMIDCIIEACSHCNVRTLFAESEADQVLALFAKAINATAILSNDTDFLIYDIDNVGLILSNGYGFADDGSMHAHIIRRCKLARILGMSVDNLYFIPSFVGNDITHKDHLREIQRILLRHSTSNTNTNTKTKKQNDKRKTNKIKTNDMIIDTNDDNNDNDYFTSIESIISSNTNTNTNTNNDNCWHNLSALKMITNAVTLLKKAEQHVYTTTGTTDTTTTGTSGHKQKVPITPVSPEELVAFVLNITTEQVNDSMLHHHHHHHPLKSIIDILLTVFRYVINIIIIINVILIILIIF
jgi:hypothetical protein